MERVVELVGKCEVEFDGLISDIDQIDRRLGEIRQPEHSHESGKAAEVSALLEKRKFLARQLLVETDVPAGRSADCLQVAIHSMWKCHYLSAAERAEIAVYYRALRRIRDLLRKSRLTP